MLRQVKITATQTNCFFPLSKCYDDIEAGDTVRYDRRDNMLKPVERQIIYANRD